jgi:hypothetical protein
MVEIVLFCRSMIAAMSPSYIRSRPCLLLIALLIAQVLGAPTLRADDDDDTKGEQEKQRYDLIFSGVFSGTGTARLGSDSLAIRGKLVDEDGQKVMLKLDAIVTAITERTAGVFVGGFSADASLDGKSLKVRGKIEPPTQESEARLTATLVYDGDKPGRIVGRVVGSKKAGS